MENKHYISTKEIIDKGSILNEKHKEYLNAKGEEKSIKWKEFYEVWQNYRAEVNAYVKTNPIDISEAL